MYQCICAYQRKALAQFHQCCQFLHFVGRQESFIISIHEALQLPIRLGRKSQVANGLDPMGRGGDFCDHRIVSSIGITSAANSPSVRVARTTDPHHADFDA